MMTRKFLFSAAAIAGCTALGGQVSDSTLIRMPRMGCEPVVDGRISRDEMRSCHVGYGAVSTQTGLLALRHTVFHFGYTDKGFYFAVRASRPVPPQKYTDGDFVTLSLLPPNAKQPVKVSFSLKSGTVLKGVKDYGVECVEVERLVAYRELGIKKPADGERWGLQMSVDYSSRKETGLWHYASDDSGYGTFIPDSRAPFASLMNLAPLDSWRTGSTYTPEFRMRNPTGRPLRIISRTFLYAGVGDSKLDDAAQAASCHRKYDIPFAVTVEAGGSAVRYARPPFPIWPGSVNTFSVEMCADRPANVICRRRFSWDLGKGIAWKDEIGLPSMKAAFYPTKGNLIRVRCAANRISTLVRASVTVAGPGGKMFFKRMLKGNPYLKTEEFTASLGELPLGDYKICFSATDKEGGEYTDEDTFSVAKFPWEGLSLGKDRVIVPPFRPITVKGDDEIEFLLTGYRCAGLFWDRVYAKGENILFAPVDMKLNGRSFSVKSARLIEKSDDRVVREVVAETDGVSLKAVQTYDYDGFCDMTLTFRADRPVEVRSLVLEMPLQERYVSLYNVSTRGNNKRAYAAPEFAIPSGEGVLWSSEQTSPPVDRKLIGAPVTSYVWLGGVERGFCWMIDSVKNMSLERDAGPQRIIRKNGSVRLESDYVNKPVVWTGEKSFRMGFQASPVKPQGEGFASLAVNMYTYIAPSNCTKLAMTGIDVPKMWPLIYPMNTLPGNDDSLIRYMVESRKIDKPDFHRRVREYAEKHRAWFDENTHETPESFRRSMETKWRATGCDYTIDYMNPMIDSCHWPEWEKYKSEWTIFDWYERNEINEYHCNIVPSRIDKLMYDALFSLKLGIRAIYYDCFEQSRDWNYIMNDAVARTEGGSVRNAVNRFFAWREIAKRTATLCYLNGGMAFGRPFTELHATSFQVIPVLSFMSTALMMERGSRGGEFQERYNESYLLTDIVCRQSGAVPRLIVTTVTGDDERKHRELKSLFGLMCAIGVFALQDQGIVNADWFDRAWNIVFDAGWGKPGSEMHWYYDGKPQPVTHNGKRVRVNVCRRGGSALLAFGNFGEAENISFDVSGLGFGKGAEVRDAETGRPVDAKSLNVPRHGYRLVRVEKK